MPTVVAHEEQKTVDINNKQICIEVFKFFKICLYFKLKKSTSLELMEYSALTIFNLCCCM